MCRLQLGKDGELLDSPSDSRVMSTALKGSCSSRNGLHTSAHVPTQAASRMDSIDVRPMPPCLTGRRSCLAALARCDAEPAAEATIL